MVWLPTLLYYYVIYHFPVAKKTCLITITCPSMREGKACMACGDTASKASPGPVSPDSHATSSMTSSWQAALRRTGSRGVPELPGGATNTLGTQRSPRDGLEVHSNPGPHHLLWQITVGHWCQETGSEGRGGLSAFGALWNSATTHAEAHRGERGAQRHTGGHVPAAQDGVPAQQVPPALLIPREGVALIGGARHGDLRQHTTHVAQTGGGQRNAADNPELATRPHPAQG